MNEYVKQLTKEEILKIYEEEMEKIIKEIKEEVKEKVGDFEHEIIEQELSKYFEEENGGNFYERRNYFGRKDNIAETLNKNMKTEVLKKTVEELVEQKYQEMMGLNDYE